MMATPNNVTQQAHEAGVDEVFKKDDNNNNATD